MLGFIKRLLRGEKSPPPQSWGPSQRDRGLEPVITPAWRELPVEPPQKPAPISMAGPDVWLTDEDFAKLLRSLEPPRPYGPASLSQGSLGGFP